MYRFTTLQRLALWRAFGERCAYSGEPLLYKDLQIDHILPESLLDSPDELQRLMENYGLDPEFEINSYYNWLPVHGRFNRQKGSLVFEEPAARFFLSMVRHRYPQTVALEAQYKRRMKRSGVLLPLGAAIESGVLSATEAIQFVQDLTEKGGFELVKEIGFVGRESPSRLTKADAENLIHQPVQHGNSHELGLVLTDGLGSERRVTSCLEHAQAQSDGFYASTTYSMKMESFFNETCGVLAALRSATVPELSYIRKPRVGVHNLELLPVSILSRMHEDPGLEAAALEGVTVQDWVEEGRVLIKAASEYSINLENEMGQILSELVRADFNGDGLEEILASNYEYAIGGSFGYGSVLMIARASPTDRFTILKP